MLQVLLPVSDRNLSKKYSTRKSKKESTRQNIFQDFAIVCQFLQMIKGVRGGVKMSPLLFPLYGVHSVMILRIVVNIAQYKEKRQEFPIFHQNVSNCLDIQLRIVISLVTYILKSSVTNFVLRSYFSLFRSCFFLIKMLQKIK